MGGSRRRIVLRHIIPNAIGTIIVNATFQVADAILFLAALGFLGLGVPASPDRLGLDALQRRAATPSTGYWWEIYPAGVAIVLVVVAFNFIGDALRDASRSGSSDAEPLRRRRARCRVSRRRPGPGRGG